MAEGEGAGTTTPATEGQGEAGEGQTTETTTSTGGEGGEGQQTAGEASGEESGGEAVVPDEYAWNMPEGMEADELMTGAFAPVLRDMQFTQEQADKFTETYAGVMQQVVERHEAAVAQQAKDWIAELKADKDYGGDALDENLATARQVIAKGGGADFAKMLEETGLSNNPAMVRFALWVNSVASVTEDTPGSGGTASSGGEKADYEKMYPDMAKAS